MKKAITVIELYNKLEEIKHRYPNAKICLPDTDDGEVRYLSDKIVWTDDNIICFDEISNKKCRCSNPSKEVKEEYCQYDDCEHCDYYR